MRLFHEDFLKQAIFWLASFILIGVPLLISTGTLFPFLTGKQTYFQTLVTLMGLAYAGLVWQKPREYKPRLNLLTGAVYLFLVALALSTLFSVDVYQSFWSTIERMDGLVHYLYFGFFFLILTSVLRTQADWLKILKSLVVSGLLVSAYALGQVLRLPGIFPALDPKRIFGSLGNPTFLAALLVFQPFLSWLLWSWERSRFWRILAGLNLLGAFVFIGLSLTRGALLGLGAAGVVLGLGLIGYWWRQGRRRLAGVLVGVALVSVILSVLLISVPNPLSEPLVKALRLKAFQEGRLPASFETRLLNWDIAWRAWQERPILGWGHSTLRYTFATYFNPKILTHADVWLEKTHNMPLEFLVNTGLVGFLSYLLIFGALFWRLWRLRSTQPVWAAALGGLFTAYFVQNLFLFDTPSTLVYLAATLGLVANLGGTDLPKQRQGGAAISKRRQTASKEGRAILSFGALGAAVLLVVVFPATSWRPWQAASLGGKAINAQNQQDLTAAFNFYQQGFQLGTYVDEKLLVESRQFLYPVLLTGQVSAKEPLVELTIQKHKEYLKKHPFSYRSYIGLGTLYLALTQQDKQFLPKATSFFNQAKKLAPKRPEAYLGLGLLYQSQREFAKAQQELEQVISLNPDYEKVWWRQAELLQSSGQSAESFALVKSIITGTRFSDKKPRLSWLQLAQFGSWPQAFWQELEAIISALPQKYPDLDPETIAYKLTLAVAKQRLGETQAAQQLVVEAMRLKPAWDKREAEQVQAILRLKPASS